MLRREGRQKDGLFDFSIIRLEDLAATYSPGP